MSALGDGHVIVVAYGDELHVYPANQKETASSLYTVGVAAYGDGGIWELSPARWAQARAALAKDIAVVMHGD